MTPDDLTHLSAAPVPTGAATACPACGAKGIRAVGSGAILTRRLRVGDPLGPCHACGWCAHTSDASDFTAATGRCEWCRRPAVRRREWDCAEHLPRPRDMGAEEFAFRAELFWVWKTRPASELVSQLLVFADWLGDRGSAEEVAARADWRPYASKKHDPAGWYQWSVPAGAGWVAVKTYREDCHIEAGHVRQPGDEVCYIDYDRARLTKSLHNGRWFLAWPPGFARFTAPLHHDPTRWRVTVEANRLEGRTPSRPVERAWPGGYSTLVAPFGGPALDVRAGLTVVRDEDLGLFAGTEGEAA